MLFVTPIIFFGILLLLLILYILKIIFKKKMWRKYKKKMEIGFLYGTRMEKLHLRISLK